MTSCSWLAAATLFAGCGPAVGSFNGSVAGERFAPKMAIWLNPSNPSGVSVTLAPQTDACELLKQRVERTPTFFFQLFGTAPGTYPVILETDLRAGKPSAGKAWGLFGGSTKAVHLTEGAFQLDSVTQGTEQLVRGSFDVKFGSDAASGTFAATPCPP